MPRTRSVSYSRENTDNTDMNESTLQKITKSTSEKGKLTARRKSSDIQASVVESITPELAKILEKRRMKLNN